MKTWEETWHACNDRLQLSADDKMSTITTFDNEGLTLEDAERDGGLERSMARAKLAAAAPEMVRMLIQIERNSRECPICHSWGPRDRSAEILTGVHHPKCELIALMRKAGVAS